METAEKQISMRKNEEGIKASDRKKKKKVSKLLIGRKRRRNSLNRSSRNAERIKNYKTPFIIILNI